MQTLIEFYQTPTGRKTNKYFTEEDLQTLIEFYQTPTGRKTIELMPQLFQESMQRTAQVLNPKIKSVMQEIIAEELQRIN
ncbi:DUF2059 domain-containing protein [Okeania hirsuta]|uniref:DUF2059 domain-containing protein n=1 Tax=Okeania hirsuta TaxID=1458930 RepID=A0A3N6P810_9CYAN|nr:DUF2059 domain-containing protein [Okeania hirsuta]